MYHLWVEHHQGNGMEAYAVYQSEDEALAVGFALMDDYGYCRAVVVAVPS